LWDASSAQRDGAAAFGNANIGCDKAMIFDCENARAEAN
jgi:hypothetical protein